MHSTRSRCVLPPAALLLVALWLVAAGVGRLCAAPAPGSDLFAGTNVPAFVIEIDAAGMEALRRDPRREARCTVRLGAEVFPDVGVHLKGSIYGSFQTIDRRPCWTLTFNRFVPGQKCHGLRKLHLNNSFEDPSFMTDVLCVAMHREAGVPAARSAHATLRLNRRELGLCVLKEGLTQDFLAQNFRQTQGNLYDGGFQIDIDRDLERLRGEGPDDRRDLRALAAAAREPDPAVRWQMLNRQLDMDRFLTGLALQVITWNWDGYAMARNNYRLYHDPATDRVVFLPHTMDQMFWEPDGSIYPRLGGMVAQGVMGTPEGLQAYRQRLTELVTRKFSAAGLGRRVDAMAALVAGSLPAAPAQAAKLKHAIAARWESMAEQLAEPAPVCLRFEQAVAALKPWQRLPDRPELSEPTVAGKAVLSIKSDRATNAAWGTRVWLPGGLYEFTARVRATPAGPGTVGDVAALKVVVGGRAVQRRVAAAPDWQEVAHRFSVRGATEVVDFACELHAPGEALFDADSLRLRRVR